MTSHILDASAVLAMLHDEAGADAVASLLLSSSISAVNWSEVLHKARAHGLDAEAIDADFASLGVPILPFEHAEARAAAAFWQPRGHSLSLADRACLGTALVHGLTAVTADRSWAERDLGVSVSVIR